MHRYLVDLEVQWHQSRYGDGLIADRRSSCLNGWHVLCVSYTDPRRRSRPAAQVALRLELRIAVDDQPREMPSSAASRRVDEIRSPASRRPAWIDRDPNRSTQSASNWTLPANRFPAMLKAGTKFPEEEAPWAS